MKPRLVIATTRLPHGEIVELVEHDRRPYLHVHGQQLAGPFTERSETELVRLACAPYRPARQPRVTIFGLALGKVLASVLTALPQSRARFCVVEDSADLVAWHRAGLAGLDPAPLADPRVQCLAAGPTAALRRLDDPQHALLLHLDAGPLYHDGHGDSPAADSRWLAAARDALQPGGMLAIAAARPQRGLERRLRSAGFEVAEEAIEAAPQAKRSRCHFLWLARRRDS